VGGHAIDNLANCGSSPEIVEHIQDGIANLAGALSGHGSTLRRLDVFVK
jgi:hypothetical protein